MTFFTDERHTKARKKPGGGVLHLFENERRRAWRQDIDRRLQTLPAEARDRIVRKLDKCMAGLGNFIGCYHELVLGSLLSAAGFAVEYEPEIGGQTPDWRVTDPAGASFIVDVLECRQSDRSLRGQEFCHTIQQELDSESAPYWIDMQWDTPSGRPPNVLPDELVESSNQIRLWLRNPLSPGDELNVMDCGLRLRVWKIDPSRSKVVWVGPSEAFMVDPVPLRSKIAQKTERYASIAQTCPFAVAVILDFAACLEAEDLLSVLAGPDGLFETTPSLSGCFHLEAREDLDWKACFIANRQASLPIADPLTRHE